VNPPLANEVVRQFQPDWVISPILDLGVGLGRWAHKAAFTMSVDSRTRFLISCSTALIPPAPAGDVSASYCALAVGPCDEDDEDKGRLVAALGATETTPKYAVVTWRSDEPAWRKSTLSAV
jgi:hypothetical protein